MKNGFRGLVLVVALCPAAAMAGSLSYNYVEGGLAIYPDAPGNQTWVGFDSRVSVELDAIHPNVFAFGGLKFLADDVDYTALHLGGGYKHSVQRNTDIWGGVTMEYQDYDPGGDDTALGLRGGIRHQVDQALELAGSARVITGDGDYVGFAGTVRYALTRDLSFLGELDVQDGDLGLIGGVSLKF